MKVLPVQLAFRVAPKRSERPVRPSRVATGYLALASIGLGVSYGAGLPWHEVLIAPVSIGLFGLLQTALAWDALVERRRSADGSLRLRLRSIDARHEWRAAELTSPRERRRLARSLRNLAREATGKVLPGPVPINRIGLRPYAERLTALATRLAAVERPVTPAGILLVHDFLAQPTSPVYERTRSEVLPIVLREIGEALEPR